MQTIDLDRPMLDWLTVTSWDNQFYRLMHEIARLESQGHEDATTQQYEGYRFQVEGGTCFVGRGEQQDREHVQVWVSGQAAHHYQNAIQPFLQSGDARTTRIDLQITCEIDSSWGQFGLMKRLKKRGDKIIGFVESGGGYERNLETVYIGSWTSDRLTRVYVKPGEEGRNYLRFETKYTGERSRTIAARVIVAGQTPGAFLKHELIDVVADPKLTALFLPALENFDAEQPRVAVTTTLDGTAKWLLKSVLPAFNRVINAHETGDSVLWAFHYAIMDKLRADGDDRCIDEEGV